MQDGKKKGGKVEHTLQWATAVAIPKFKLAFHISP